MKIKNTHPQWALKHKKPGTELRLIKGRYYLYEVSSKWNKEKKRAQKVTGKILGRITEDKGFISSNERAHSILQTLCTRQKILTSASLLSTHT